MKGGGQGGDALHQFVDVEVHWTVISSCTQIDRLLQIERQGVVVEQRLGVHPDHAVDDELQARQTHTGVGQPGKAEGPVRVTYVHHDLEGNIGHGIDAGNTPVILEQTFVNITRITFGTRDGDITAILQNLGGITTTHYGGNAQLTR